ncbi:MAG: fatty acid desaturase [Oligoflexus sp.]
MPKKTWRAWLALLLDSSLFLGISTLILLVDHVLIGSLLGLLLPGLVLTGFFVLGHDAGHRSFSDSERVNDFVGHLTTSFLGWPFHLWRLAHNVHHLHTNHVKMDIAWEPHTNKQIHRLPAFFRWTYTTVRSKIWAFWAGAFFHNLELWWKFFQRKLYRPEDRSKVWFSIVLTILATTSYAALAFALGSWYGLLTLFILPLIGFYFWMTTFTLLHHTHPDINFLQDKEWNKVEAQLDGTINVLYGKIVDWFTHDIAWHLHHHTSVAIPFYYLKDAQRHLQQAFPDRVKSQAFTLSHLLAVLRHCQAIKNFNEPTWTPFVTGCPDHGTGQQSSQA